MFSLDIRTAYLIAGLAGIVCAATVFLLRHLHTESSSAAKLMGSAMGLGGLCLVFSAMRSTHSSASFLWISMFCGGACLVLMFEATRSLYRQPSRMIWSCLALVTLGTVLALAPDARSSLVVHFGFQALAALCSLITAIRGRDENSPAGRYGLMILFICFVAAGCSRFWDAINTNALTLTSPDFRFGTSQGPVVLLYTLSPLVLMSLFLSILHTRQIAGLIYTANTDELTGLSSRRYLISQAQAWRTDMALAKKECVLLMIDIDHFKSINDQFGHGTGDAVLRHLSKVLRGQLRKDAILARYGGEEFCALVPIHQDSEAFNIAERLRDAVQANPFSMDTNKDRPVIKLTVSIGVAQHGTKEALQDVLELADKRLYEAKKQGRNRVVWQDPQGHLLAPA